MGANKTNVAHLFPVKLILGCYFYSIWQAMISVQSLLHKKTAFGQSDQRQFGWL